MAEPRHKQISGHQAQIIITLSAEGKLQAELPGVNGTRRVVPLRGGVEPFTGEPILERTLVRLLEGQQNEQYEIGQDGAPTNQQVTHWEKHDVWADARCRFCIAEGRIKPARPKKEQRSELIAKTAGLEIRRLTEVRKKGEAKAKAEGQVIVSTKSMEDLGL